MIIKNKFKISKLFYVFLLISIFTASFKNFCIIFFLITIHEFGHALMAKILGIATLNITIYPLGGITKLKMDINTDSIKEFLILINGPLFQWLAYFLLTIILKEEKELIRDYHILLLVFNLLPIYPLDGGKLILLLLEEIIPFKKCQIIIIWLSYLTSIFFLWKIHSIKGNVIITIIFIWILITKELKKRKSIWNKFILERYLNEYHFKKKRIVKRIEDFYKDRNHIIIEDNKRYLETDFLKKLFKNS